MKRRGNITCKKKKLELLQYKCHIKAYPQYISSSVNVKSSLMCDYNSTSTFCLVRYCFIFYVIKHWLLHSFIISSVFPIWNSFFYYLSVALSSFGGAPILYE